MDVILDAMLVADARLLRGLEDYKYCYNHVEVRFGCLYLLNSKAPGLGRHFWQHNSQKSSYDRSLLARQVCRSLTQAEAVETALLEPHK